MDESNNKMDNLIIQLLGYCPPPKTHNIQHNKTDIQHDKTDIQHDKTDIQHDKADIQHDKADIQHDKADKEQIKQNIQQLQIHKQIPKETPEYYANETIRFLNDICNEKDKKIQLFNKILNFSFLINILLISYIIGNYKIIYLQIIYLYKVIGF
jgi:hypothetical protein